MAVESSSSSPCSTWCNFTKSTLSECVINNVTISHSLDCVPLKIFGFGSSVSGLRLRGNLCYYAFVPDGFVSICWRGRVGVCVWKKSEVVGKEIYSDFDKTWFVLNLTDFNRFVHYLLVYLFLLLILSCISKYSYNNSVHILFVVNYLVCICLIRKSNLFFMLIGLIYHTKFLCTVFVW